MTFRNGRRAGGLAVAFSLLFSAVTFAGCSGPASVPTEGADPWGDLAPRVARDNNPAPRVVEVTLEAGLSTHPFAGFPATPVWSYNGSVPGPLLEANVGDELVVHFTNRLPRPTTIHWHGVRVPNAMDGVMGITPETPPGGSFDYRFALKDAGLFWFHPHVESDVQVNNGLYGVLRVRGAEEPKVDHEGVVVLDDLGLLPDGTIPTVLDDNAKMMGRGGDILLFNGRRAPTVPWRAGALERLRFVNAANGRFFNLRLEGYVFRVIGSDGGLLTESYDTERILIPPGKRFDVVVIPKGAPGAKTVLWNDPYDRGHEGGHEPSLAVATFEIASATPLTGRVLPTVHAALERLPGGPIDRTIALDEALDAAGDVTFTINGKSGADVPVIAEHLGAVRRYEVKNLSDMDHPFHLHGFFFQVQSRDGVPQPPNFVSNEDTIVVPAHASAVIAIRFDEPGMWPYHCHILEHAEYGMMGMIDVMK